MKNYIVKRYLSRLLCAVLIVCTAFAFSLSLAARPDKTARAEENPYTEFTTNVSVENAQFTTSAASFPAAPSAWTGEYGTSGGGNAVTGIIPLTSEYTVNKDKIKLDIYPEYKNDVPVTPFGNKQGNYYPNTNKNVLMINTNKTRTVYGYSSTEVSMTANSFYVFSVWAKTGSFSQNSGAAVTLTGLDEAVGIWNIDTVSRLKKTSDGIPELTSANNYGFREYRILVGVGPTSANVSLKLSVGDYADELHYYPSNGYALFDNVNVHQYSPTNFYRLADSLKDNPDVCIYDMNFNNPVSGASVQPVKGNAPTMFEDFNADDAKKNWTRITDEETTGGAQMFWELYNGAGTFLSDSRPRGLEIDPFTPIGKFTKPNNIMVLSTYNAVTKTFGSTKAGIRSASFPVERDSIYLLNLWYNTQNISGGGASIVISGESTSYANKLELNPVANNNLTSDNNKERYGWNQASFYIKGSAVKDIVQINVELWLGYGQEGGGVAMFDDITLKKLTYKEFTDNKYGGETVTVDELPSSEMTGGLFNEIAPGEDGEIELDANGYVAYPARPAGWTFIDTATANTHGHSNRLVSTEKAVYGNVPVDSALYDNVRPKLLNAPNPIKDTGGYPARKVLFMGSTEKTAFGYRSEALTIDGNRTITVSILSRLEGYGACLVLKNGNKIVNTIEKINNATSSFKDYTFYVGAESTSVALTLEIWFGMTDKAINESKLTSGWMFVSAVTTAAYDGDITTLAQQFNKSPLQPTEYSVYMAGSFDYSAYDRYSNDTVKEAYEFSVAPADQTTRSGIISTSFTPGQSDIPEYFWLANHESDAYNKTTNVMYMQNLVPAYSTLTSASTINLQPDMFYRIDFSVLVELKPDEDDNGAINDKGIGAGILLDSKGFENIRDTLKTPGTIVGADENGYIYRQDYEFKTFTFLYATGENAESLKWSITLGGNNYSNEVMAGRVFINSILLSSYDEYDFRDEVSAYNKMVKDEKTEADYMMVVDKSKITEPEDTGTVTPPDTNANLWALIPSIIFAIAILGALMVVFVRKFSKKLPRNLLRERVVSYDRKHTLDQIGEGDGTGYIPVTADKVFESFADDRDVSDDPSIRAARPEKIAEKAVGTEVEADEFNEFDD